MLQSLSREVGYSVDFDPCFQVPLLLSIGEEDTALTKATESGDTDLVYLVLFHIWQKVSLEFCSSKRNVHLIHQSVTVGSVQICFPGL